MKLPIITKIAWWTFHVTSNVTPYQSQPDRLGCRNSNLDIIIGGNWSENWIKKPTHTHLIARKTKWIFEVLHWSYWSDSQFRLTSYWLYPHFDDWHVLQSRKIHQKTNYRAEDESIKICHWVYSMWVDEDHESTAFLTFLKCSNN